MIQGTSNENSVHYITECWLYTEIGSMKYNFSPCPGPRLGVDSTGVENITIFWWSIGLKYVRIWWNELHTLHYCDYFRLHFPINALFKFVLHTTPPVTVIPPSP